MRYTYRTDIVTMSEAREILGEHSGPERMVTATQFGQRSVMLVWETCHNDNSPNVYGQLTPDQVASLDFQEMEVGVDEPQTGGAVGGPKAVAASQRPSTRARRGVAALLAGAGGRASTTPEEKK